MGPPNAMLYYLHAMTVNFAVQISWSTDAFTMAVSLGSGQTALVDTRQVTLSLQQF
jgi:hypothetical protein